jgi:hypothetical protein
MNGHDHAYTESDSAIPDGGYTLNIPVFYVIDSAWRQIDTKAHVATIWETDLKAQTVKSGISATAITAV